jgi:NTP pyrophosphatase (non-canonical NTP hydrolase)
MQTILDEVLAEVNRATTKFPTWPTDPIHACNVLIEEAGELAKAVNEHTYEPHKTSKDDVKKEALQVAAMALRFLMSFSKYEYRRSGQHEQEPIHL